MNINSNINNTMKKYCPTHHLYYEGNECPICMQERCLKYSEKMVLNATAIPKDVQDKNRNITERTAKVMDEITEEKLNQLINKFKKQ